MMSKNRHCQLEKQWKFQENLLMYLYSQYTGNWLISYEIRFRVDGGVIFHDLDFDKEVTDDFGPGHSWCMVRGVSGNRWKLWGRMLNNRLLQGGLHKAGTQEQQRSVSWKREEGLQQDIKSRESTWHGKACMGLYYPVFFVSFLFLCLSASIFWNSTAIAWRLVDITGCPAPHLISIHTCPLSPEA